MKRTFVVSVIILVVISVLFMIWYTYPIQHTKTVQGVFYESGNESNKAVDQVNIHIDGNFQKSITGKRKFSGTIEVEGEALPIPNDNRDVVIKFRADGWGPLVYAGYLEDGTPFTHGYGSIFITDDFSKVTIIKGDWSGGQGVLITSPATNRTEALQISNELMSDFLNGITIE